MAAVSLASGLVFGGLLRWRPRQDHFDFNHDPRLSEACDLNRRARRQIGLLRRAEELGIGIHESLEIHLAFLGGVAYEEYEHLDHIAKTQALLIQRGFDVAEDTQRLCLGISPVLRAALRGFGILRRRR